MTDRRVSERGSGTNYSWKCLEFVDAEQGIRRPSRHWESSLLSTTSFQLQLDVFWRILMGAEKSRQQVE
jgi:hypothetical protein